MLIPSVCLLIPFWRIYILFIPRNCRTTMNQAYYSEYDSPIGLTIVVSCKTGICKISLPNTASKTVFTWINQYYDSYEKKRTKIIDDAIKELNQYFRRKRKKFSTPIQLHGTPFQKKVWKALQKISYGETTTYGEIAQQIKKPNAARAVGRAIGRNPIPIIVPCHRVIGAQGDLVGYGGGLPLKQKLLRLEKTLPPPSQKG